MSDKSVRYSLHIKINLEEVKEFRTQKPYFDGQGSKADENFLFEIQLWTQNILKSFEKPLWHLELDFFKKMDQLV